MYLQVYWRDERRTEHIPGGDGHKVHPESYQKTCHVAHGSYLNSRSYVSQMSITHIAQFTTFWYVGFRRVLCIRFIGRGFTLKSSEG